MTSDARYYREGAVLPSTNWPEAKEVDLQSHGRLTLRGVELGGGVKLPRQIFDTQLGTPCTFRPDPTGTLRCYPSPHFIDLSPPYFAEAACTTRVAAVHSSSCTVGGYAVYPDDSQGLPQKNHAYHLGPKHEGPLYSGRPGACRELGWMPEKPMYVVGAEIEATSLVEGTASMN
ncbi:hypothetical protein JY572_37645 [Myxococcus landrumensis]|uniref:Uncharacterized protein n=1 Tax=Myxococcus landrumensis TaxID=2813577 RepID=A0ABX7N983_9BACT|nr:hypothetical protein [Myxococcus landrumus]QSQ13981.1 hypothetical protein JY572_37645 [Myxococcus landrumus]